MNFPDYQEIYGVTSQQIRDAATHPQSGANALASVASEMSNDHQQVTSDASGTLTSDITANVTHSQKALTLLSGKGSYAASMINLFADKVDVFDTTVHGLNQQRSALASSLMRTIDPSTDERMKSSDAQAQATNAFVSDYNKAVQLLDEDADDVETMLTQGPTDANVKALVHAGLMSFAAAAALGVVLTNADKAAFHEARMRDMTPTQRVDYLLQTSIDQAVMNLILRDDKATATAAVTRATTTIDNILTGDIDGAKALGDLNSMLSKFGGSLAFATPLMSQMGPQKLMQLNLNIATWTSDESPKASYDIHGTGGPTNPAMAAMITQFQQLMGGTLATSTGGPGGYPAGTPIEYQLRYDFMEDLQKAGTTKLTSPGLQAYGYQALAPLLTTGKFSPEFLSRVGWGMYIFDQTPGEHGGGPWYDTLPQGNPILGGGTGGIRLDWTHGTGSGQSAGFDPMGGLMTALGNNPEASQRFFNEHTTDGTKEWNAIIKYMMNERHWGLGGLDQPWHADAVDERGWYDKDIGLEKNDMHLLDPLGKALLSATSGNDQNAATLFGDVVQETAAGDFKGDRFADMRDEFALMARHHIGSINTALTGDGAPGIGGDIDPVTKGIQHDPGFGTDNIDVLKFLNSIGRDDAAKTTLTGAEAYYMQSGYQHFMGGTGSLNDRIALVSSNINTPMAKVFGALDWGTNDATFEKHAQEDQEHNSQVDSKYEVIGFFKDKVPFGKIPVGGDVVGIGVDKWLEALKESEYQDTSAIAQSLVGQLHGGSANHLQNTMELTLFANMSEADKAQYFKDPTTGEWTIPATADGHPKPMSQWTATDAQKYNDALNKGGGGHITAFGQGGSTQYQVGYNTAQTELGK